MISEYDIIRLVYHIRKAVIQLEKNSMVKCAAGGICALMMGGAALLNAADNNDNELYVSYTTESDADLVHEIFSDTSAQVVSRITPDMDVEISFSAAPVREQDGMAVFALDGQPSYIYAPLEDFNVGEVITVSGVISYIDGTTIMLESCEEIIAVELPAAAHTTSSVEDKAEPTVTVNESTVSDTVSVTVYVSSSGKYHSKPDCSGMKYYTQMSLDDAIQHGHVACKRCY